MQDSFLPHVETGTIILLGATTENPSFRLNSALLSRCRVVVLEKLSTANVEHLLKRALAKLNADVFTGEVPVSPDKEMVWIDSKALRALADFSDGDARSALNGLQLAVQTKRVSLNAKLENPDTARISKLYEEKSRVSPTTACKNVQCEEDVNSIVSIEDIKFCLQRTPLLYDHTDQRYNCISALHKSMRGSDANASLYWLARMLCAGEDPLYVARRVISFASEDVGKVWFTLVWVSSRGRGEMQRRGLFDCTVEPLYS